MEKLRNYRLLAIGLVVLASGLHAYESFVLSSTPSLGWFAWGMLPYAWCALALFATSKGLPAAVGASSGLAIDLFIHYDVFMQPTGSTAALALLFIPIWSTLIFVPLPLFACAWILARKESNDPRAL